MFLYISVDFQCSKTCKKNRYGHRFRFNVMVTSSFLIRRLMLMMDTEPDQQHQHPPQKQKRLSRRRWTPSLDKVLADLVVKQINQGNRQNNGFDRKTWVNMRNEFNHQTGLNYNNNQLRKHLNVLRQRYDSVKSSQLHNQLVMEDDAGGCILGLDLWEDFGVSL